MDLHNPLLLEVKMFLSELPWVRHQQYEYPYRVCTHFTKDVFDQATNLGMRCACVIVYFEGIDIAHAIIGFETDYGLIYIEPQSGNQEYIIVGSSYPSSLMGIQSDDIVSSMQWLWNDGSPIYWLECFDCGYILPTYEITISQCSNCGSKNTGLQMPKIT